MKKRYKVLVSAVLALMLLGAGGVAYAHFNHGIPSASATPTTASPGDTLAVAFDYRIQHFPASIPNPMGIGGLHSPGNIPWCNDGWRVMLDPALGEPVPGTTGTMLASGLGGNNPVDPCHPVDATIKTYKVSTPVALPPALPEGTHTLGVATDVNAGLPGAWGCGVGCHLGAAERVDITIKVVRKAIIDIKPGSWPNSINSGNKGVIPVAILNTGLPNILNPADVDVNTVKFGPTGTEASPVQSAMGDVDGDGDMDLILHFRTQDSKFKAGDTEGVITGKTKLPDGKDFLGKDAVRIVK